MKKDLTERVNFEIIRYANCWEDADILMEGLSPKAGDKVLSIGSAGDNSFSLLAANPEIVVAVDVNKTQLYLIELKKACIKRLEYEELLAFLGFRPSSNRGLIFQQIKHELSTEAGHYWEQNIRILRDGVIYHGKFEKFFILFSCRILPFIHSRNTIAELFRPKSVTEQQHFYDAKWNSWRWRLTFKLFFNKYIVGKYGRDPEFLKEVKVSVADYTYGKAARQLQSLSAQTNFMLRFNLTGNFGPLFPNYLQRTNYEKIKQNLDSLIIMEGYAQDAIGKYGKFHCMNLSNIFEYMDKTLFRDTAEALVNGTQKDGKLAYWNLMVPRRVSETFPDKAAYLADLSRTLTDKDKGYFYNQFIIDKKI